MNNESKIDRFTDAQKNSYQVALKEIKNGRKQSHWMWFIFPQIQGLGFSQTSKFYAIKDTAEAEEFLHHPVLGERLITICKELLELSNWDANKIFGSPDDLKLHSSMTLFSSLHGTDPVFQMVLDRFFYGTKDQKTLDILGHL